VEEFDKALLQKDKTINDLKAQLNSSEQLKSTRENELQASRAELKNVKEANSKLENSLNELMSKFKSSEKNQKENFFRSSQLEKEVSELKTDNVTLGQHIEIEQEKASNAQKLLKEAEANIQLLKDKIQVLTIELNKSQADTASCKELKEQYSSKL